MDLSVYILQSETTERFYVGQTNNLEKRLRKHNAGKVNSTRNGAPWRVIWSSQMATRSMAMQLERKIKKRGARRYLEDMEDQKYISFLIDCLVSARSGLTKKWREKGRDHPDQESNVVRKDDFFRFEKCAKLASRYFDK